MPLDVVDEFGTGLPYLIAEDAVILLELNVDLFQLRERPRGRQRLVVRNAVKVDCEGVALPLKFCRLELRDFLLKSAQLVLELSDLAVALFEQNLEVALLVLGGDRLYDCGLLVCAKRCNLLLVRLDFLFGTLEFGLGFVQLQQVLVPLFQPFVETLADVLLHLKLRLQPEVILDILGEPAFVLVQLFNHFLVGALLALLGRVQLKNLILETLHLLAHLLAVVGDGVVRVNLLVQVRDCFSVLGEERVLLRQLVRKLLVFILQRVNLVFVVLELGGHAQFLVERGD